MANQKQSDQEIFHLKVSNNHQHHLWFFTALTALDIFSTDNNDEFDTCGF